MRWVRRLIVHVGEVDIGTGNVSRNGVQLVCPEVRFFAIERGVRSGALNARIEVPGMALINTQLRVTYFSTLSDEVLIGTELWKLSADDRRYWDKYIDGLEPAPSD